MSVILPALIVAISMMVGVGAAFYVSGRFSNFVSLVSSAFIGAAVGGMCGVAFPEKASDGGAIYAYLVFGAFCFVVLNGVVRWANDA